MRSQSALDRFLRLVFQKAAACQQRIILRIRMKRNRMQNGPLCCGSFTLLHKLRRSSFKPPDSALSVSCDRLLNLFKQLASKKRRAFI